MEWWDDIWLNEGFACYMENLATDALFPDYKMWEQYTTDAMASALRLDALKTSHPIQASVSPHPPSHTHTPDHSDNIF